MVRSEPDIEVDFIVSGFQGALFRWHHRHRNLGSTSFYNYFLGLYLSKVFLNGLLFSDPKLGPFLFLLLKAPVGNRRMIRLISNSRPISQSHLNKCFSNTENHKFINYSSSFRALHMERVHEIDSFRVVIYV